MQPSHPTVFRKGILIVSLTVAIASGFELYTWYQTRYQAQNHSQQLKAAPTDIGIPSTAYNVLFLGCDLPYSYVAPRVQVADQTAFNGRSDTIFVIHVDPQRQTVTGVHIPRDTVAHIPGFGYQKINGANALGGPQLAKDTVAGLLQVPVEHFVVLNVHGLVEAVDALGGITLEVPKKMSYMDWTAKLKIDLQPGVHTLTGNQAMGFVRFRHDELGDIGRVQRQELFMRAFMNKALTPTSWLQLPKLVEIARRNIRTDITDMELVQSANLVRSIPRKNIQFALLPGRFGPQGSWVTNEPAVRRLIGRTFTMQDTATQEFPKDLTVSVQNVSSYPGIETQVSTLLRSSGYSVNVLPPPRNLADSQLRKHASRIITQEASYQAAEALRKQLGNTGEIVNESVGDIYSNITVMLDDDMKPILDRMNAATAASPINGAAAAAAVTIPDMKTF